MKLAASILLFALLMAIRDDVENVYLRMLVAAAAGASLSLVLVNSNRGRERASQPAVRGVVRGPLWIATMLYVVSWFLPVIKEGWTLDRGLPGWQAFTTVLDPLWNPQHFGENPWFALLGIASGLTNVFMVIALVRLHAVRSPESRLWRWWAWAAAAINASWIGFDWHDQSFQVGYFFWLLSFVFLAVSIMARGHRKQVEGPQPSTP
jgi:hypothetical protein